MSKQIPIEDEIIKAYKPLIDESYMPTTSLKIRKSVPKYTITQTYELIEHALEAMENGSSVIEINGPAVIVGDIHGNLPDLLAIFRRFGTPAERRYVFLGDYVDRGEHSVPVLHLLLSYLVKYPKNLTLLRGNHEFVHINHEYGFYDEITELYKNDKFEALFLKFQEVFGFMPLAAIVSKRIFCVHGGMSPLLKSIDDLRSITLPIKGYDTDQIVCDIVWSDPYERNGFVENTRGAGILFGRDTIMTFLKENKLKLLVRAHQCNATGVNLFAANLGVTVFSSSDYNRILQNRCGVIFVKEGNELELHSLSKGAEQGYITRVEFFEGMGVRNIPKITQRVGKTPRFTKPQSDLSHLPKMDFPKTPHYQKVGTHTVVGSPTSLGSPTSFGNPTSTFTKSPRSPSPIKRSPSPIKVPRVSPPYKGRKPTAPYNLMFPSP